MCFVISLNSKCIFFYGNCKSKYNLIEGPVKCKFFSSFSIIPDLFLYLGEIDLLKCLSTYVQPVFPSLCSCLLTKFSLMCHFPRPVDNSYFIRYDWHSLPFFPCFSVIYLYFPIWGVDASYKIQGGLVESATNRLVGTDNDLSCSSFFKFTFIIDMLKWERHAYNSLFVP